MDFYFSENSKPEREFQQLIARENNFSTIANQSEYFVQILSLPIHLLELDLIYWLYAGLSLSEKVPVIADRL